MSSQEIEQEGYDMGSKDNKYEQQDEEVKREQYKSEGSSQVSEQNEQDSQDEVQLSEKQQLEREILKEAASLEESSTYQEEITSEIIDKLNNIAAVTSSKTGEELVNLRIQELVFNKLLVLNYGKSDFRLVLAHYHLSQAYLAYDCIQQAIEHLSLAMHKNQKMFQEIPNTKSLQVDMQITLAESFIEQENYQDAIQLLARAVELEESLKNTSNQQSRKLKALVFQARCYCKLKSFDTALKIIENVLEISKKKKMAKIQYAFSLVEKANILAAIDTFDRYQKAIQIQQNAISILVDENFSKPEEVAEMYSTLAGYFEKVGNSQNSLNCIQKVKTLYSELYSPEDKRVIKARRRIATAMLKGERYKEAVNELLQIVELEEKVFGETSIQTGRTLKLLGTVYISLEVSDARAYLKRAMNIFSNLGNKKQAQEIKQKLKMLLNQKNHQLDLKIISQQEI